MYLSIWSIVSVLVTFVVASALPKDTFPLKGRDVVAGNATTPMQMRLSYAGATGMTISWNTYTKLDNPTVRYGTSQFAITLQANSTDSVTYPTSMTYNNHVKIEGLKSDTMYYYQVVGGNSVASFRTARVPGDGTSFVVAAVVDLGLIGPDGLSETSQNALAPGETSTIDSLTGQLSNFDRLLHRKYQNGAFVRAMRWRTTD